MTATHPAIQRAQGIYDRPGDLTPPEQEFLLAVHRIRLQRTETVRAAIDLFGFRCGAYFATMHRADRTQADDLATALDVYEQSLEDQDELDEIELVTEIE